MANHLYYGYDLDPPFNSQATYNVLLRAPHRWDSQLEHTRSLHDQRRESP